MNNKVCILIPFLISILGCSSLSINAQPVPPDTSTIYRQEDLIDVLSGLDKSDQEKNDSSRMNKKFQFSLAPLAGTVAGGGRAIATSLNVSFYSGDRKKTSQSTITFSPWFSFDGKFVLPFRSLMWLPNDLLLAKGDTRFMIYPAYTWGIGGNVDHENKVLIQYDYFRFYHSFLRKYGKRVYFGGGYNLDYHFDVNLESDSSLLKEIPYYDYRTQTDESVVSSGPVINFLIDTRHNSVNPPDGVYFAADYRFNMEFLGSTNNWQSLVLDARKYYSFNKHRQNLLAFWAMYWAVTTGKCPYLDLPSIGWDYHNRTGRGFEQGQYKGRQLIYFESEYRRDISRNGLLGFVLFANLSSVSEYEGNRFVYWQPAAGTGLRIKFNKISRTNIGIDFAKSKDNSSFYFSLGEAF